MCFEPPLYCFLYCIYAVRALGFQKHSGRFPEAAPEGLGIDGQVEEFTKTHHVCTYASVFVCVCVGVRV